MAIHSSLLAWEIPWTQEPGGLPSIGRKESDGAEHAHRLSDSIVPILCSQYVASPARLVRA